MCVCAHVNTVHTVHFDFFLLKQDLSLGWALTHKLAYPVSEPKIRLCPSASVGPTMPNLTWVLGMQLVCTLAEQTAYPLAAFPSPMLHSVCQWTKMLAVVSMLWQISL